MEPTARELIRAVRGTRSQVAFARRLGYRGNPVADWEAGRRFPTMAELLRACARVGIDVSGALQRFHAVTAPALGDPLHADVGAWLRALQGGTPIVEVARKAGLSRYAVARALSGEAHPRVPDALRLVDALTGRVSDWVAALVPIESVPTLAEEHRQRMAARRLAFDEPWTAAVLRLLETEAYRALPAHRAGWIGKRLGVSKAVETRCLAALEAAGVVSKHGGRYAEVQPLAVDTGDRAATAGLKAFWANIARERIPELREGELASYNVFSVSREDLDRIRDLHRAYFRQVRAIVNSTARTETVALVMVQLVDFDPDVGR